MLLVLLFIEHFYFLCALVFQLKNDFICFNFNSEIIVFKIFNAREFIYNPSSCFLFLFLTNIFYLFFINFYWAKCNNLAIKKKKPSLFVNIK